MTSKWNKTKLALRDTLSVLLLIVLLAIVIAILIHGAATFVDYSLKIFGELGAYILIGLIIVAYIYITIYQNLD